MDHYVGPDVPLEQTSVCVVDGSGGTLWLGECASDPEALAATIRAGAPAAVRELVAGGPLEHVAEALPAAREAIGDQVAASSPWPAGTGRCDG
jgi:hypothetical protein